jgi:hypothetical protein
VPRPRLLLLLLVLVLGGAAAPAEAAPALYSDVDQFRADVGGREINWDDRAAGSVSAKAYKPRGAVLGAAGTVSNQPSQAYSPPNLFRTTGSTTTTVTFVVPGTSTTALTRAFGVVFSNPSTTAKLELLDRDGQVLESGKPEPGSLSFVGIALDDGRVARVRITGAPLDNFLYAEPQEDIDSDGIAENDPDADGDAIPNARDAFPLDRKESVDTDRDGVGDNADTDDDDDGLPDATEGRLGTDPKRVDTDGDTNPDGKDNCPLVANADQADRNGDGRGDACADRRAPVLWRLKLRPARFSAGSKFGTRVSFRLSEAAAVELRVQRVVRGRRRAVPGRIDRQGTRGANFVRFTGQIAGRGLRAGRYVLLARATDAAGNPTRRATRTSFTIVG